MAINKSFWQFFDLTDWRRPPAELKVASALSDQNPVGTLYEMISVLNAIFYENIKAHYVIMQKKHVQMRKKCP